MRGFLYLLAIAGMVAAQNNQTVQALKVPPSPSTTEEAFFSVAGGGGYGHPTCQAVTKTKTVWDKPSIVTITKPGPKETVTTTCFETKTVHDTKTLTSTTTCTVVSSIFFLFISEAINARSLNQSCTQHKTAIRRQLQQISRSHGHPSLGIRRLQCLGPTHSSILDKDANECTRPQRSQASTSPLPR